MSAKKSSPPVRCLFDKMVAVDELKSHPRNRNKHPDDQIERLGKIIAYQGWRYPVKVSKRSGFVTSGHGRLLAAKLMGWKSVPVNYQDYESNAQEYADVQADNAITTWAELDLASVHADLRELNGRFDRALLGVRGFGGGEIVKEEDLPSLSNLVKSEANTFSFTLVVPKKYAGLFENADKTNCVEHLVKLLKLDRTRKNGVNR